MSLQTPKARSGLARPSYGSSPSNNNLSASTAVNRKASLQALTGQADPKTPGGKMLSDLQVGDAVNVPGDMYGVVKFIGTVRGKSGKFVGVELDKDFASRGKNDGDVDGTHYFRTSIPGSGIFLPVHRAEKRFSPSASISDSFPGTPDTPTYSTVNGVRAKAQDAQQTPPTPALPHKFAQTVGPGVRPPSPSFKPKRPSLPRPESPLRRNAPNLAPTPARTLSQSQRGGPRPGLTPSKNLKSSTTSRPPTAGQMSRPYSRSSSRQGGHEDDRSQVGLATTSNGRTTSQGSIPSFSQPLRSPSRLGSAGGQEQEISRLKQQLAERDRRLDEQATSLAEMEQSVKELSAILPQDGSSSGRKGSLASDDEQSAAQLRQLLREKNEKISLLTAEFDAHRADFRSTLDSLEMASTETERVYEEQKRDLLAQLAEMQELNQSKEDFEGVARQLKSLEELVAELEEGLEESRRGEAEARGEVEFLRGEVERGRSELKREREKAAAVMKGAENGESVNYQKELDQKDDEIRGLKAIIHSFSSTNSNGAATTENGVGVIADPDEVKRLQSALDDSQREKEDLEKELEQLRRDSAQANGNGHVASVHHERSESERTATAPESGTPGRRRTDTIKASPERVRHANTNSGGAVGAAGMPVDGVYCEMCESADHDTLDCAKLQGTAKEVDSPGKENKDVSKGAAGKVAEEDKWCALCEKDGHLAFDCPEEQY